MRFQLLRLGSQSPEIYHFGVITFRSITVVFVLGWISTGIVFVAGHAGVAQLGDTIESFVVYYFCWRCASCPKPFGSTVSLVMSKEEIRARRDPAKHLAMILTGVVALWQLAIIIAAPGSQTWVTYTAMLAIVPVVFFVAWVALRPSKNIVGGPA